MNRSGKESWAAPQGPKDERLKFDAVKQREQEGKN